MKEKGSSGLVSPVYELSAATAISPIDGRYNQKTLLFSEYFSEMALMRYRTLVEVEYFIALWEKAGVIRLLEKEEKNFLRSLYRQFDIKSFNEIKTWEKKTNHDVNAVVRWLKEKISETSLGDLMDFVHFGLTSEDINNTAFAFMLRGGIELLFNEYKRVLESLHGLVVQNNNTPMLARTHGQPASPTTIDWETNVFYQRLFRALNDLRKASLLVKFGGATGGHNALYIAYPHIDWRMFSQIFIEDVLNKARGSSVFSLNEQGENNWLIAFEYNPYTTQVESHDTYAKLFDILRRGNVVLLDFCKDMWSYISQEYFTQKPIEGEDGSSAMPNKINPIDFENAEGNLGVANALLEFFSRELPISRAQRHLSDSTIIRNFGTAFAHISIALQAINKGLGKVYVNEEKLRDDLNDHWEVVTEAYQIILRREGVPGAYDLLKEITRGRKITRKVLYNFVDRVGKDYKLSREIISKLKEITPDKYIGYRVI